MARALLRAAGKKAAKGFRDYAMEAVPEALSSGAMTTGLGLIIGQPADEAVAMGAADAIGSTLTLGLLGKAGVKNGLIRNVANVITGVGSGQLLHNTIFKDRYAQPEQQVLQGQGGQAVTNAQQQIQRAAVNNMPIDQLAGKYLEDTMFQAMQGQGRSDLVRMMNDMGPTYDMSAARGNMAAIMNV